mmetsp:Transcript_44973/g.106812  ORF Transcript_44973/g.106812 Transcript_44973/m.106812 type:complete len:240 (+) Transcript_44973:358-1077(+)
MLRTRGAEAKCCECSLKAWSCRRIKATRRCRSRSSISLVSAGSAMLWRLQHLMRARSRPGPSSPSMLRSTLLLSGRRSLLAPTGRAPPVLLSMLSARRCRTAGAFVRLTCPAATFAGKDGGSILRGCPVATLVTVALATIVLPVAVAPSLSCVRALLGAPVAPARALLQAGSNFCTGRCADRADGRVGDGALPGMPPLAPLGGLVVWPLPCAFDCCSACSLAVRTDTRGGLVPPSRGLL